MKKAATRKKPATRTAKKGVKKSTAKTVRGRTSAKSAALKKKTTAKAKTAKGRSAAAKRTPSKPATSKKATSKRSTAKKATTAKKSTPKATQKTAAKRKPTAARSAAAAEKLTAVPKRVTPPVPVISTRDAPVPSPASPTTSTPGQAAAETVIEQPIGTVTHYYSHLSVAVVQLNEGNLQVGDTIRIKGHTTNLEQPIESMEVDHQSVQQASSGQVFGLKVRDHVREHDQIYKG